jgi:CIC family chloride channel protein
VILGDFSTGAFGVVVLTSVIASAVMQALDTGGIVFTHATAPELGISSYTLGGLQELPLYILLGVLIAPISAIFIRTLYWQHDLWHNLKLSQPVKTALAGVVVAGMAIFLPQIMGTGRETLNTLLNANTAEFALWVLVALVVVKIVATSVSLGGGFVGGMFAPSLFVGAAAGRAFGQVLAAVFPGVFTANPAAFAIAGMAASMAGVIRSPITAIILLFELTDDYRLILPIMLTTAVSLIVVERLAPDGLYHFGLARRGIRLVRGRDIDLMQTISVRDVMTTSPRTVRAALPLSELAKEFGKDNSHGLIVVDDKNMLYGLVTLHDLARASENETLDGHVVGEICTRNVLTVTPHTPVADALKLLGARNWGRLPVVDAHNPQKVVGILRRHDIVRAYDLAMQRKQENAQRVEQVQLETLSNAHILELRVEPGSRAADHAIHELEWPAGSVVATVRRQGKVIVPHGNTGLRAGDILTVVSMEEELPDLAELVSAQEAPKTKASYEYVDK